MHTVKKVIFGKGFRFSCDDVFADALDASIALYPDYHSDKFDVSVHIVSSLPGQNQDSQNPRIFKQLESGIEIQLGNHRIVWRPGAERLEATLEYNHAGRIKSALAKYVGKEFSSEVELFEQVLHELVLVPSVYFFDDIAPLHAASIRFGDQVIMLAGTGGAGKSSGLIALRNLPNSSFMADDISIIGNDGSIYGNMAWPKIYGYNCDGNDIEKLLLRDRGFLDRLQFSIKKRINPNTVRRKIPPNEFFTKICHAHSGRTRLTYLFRERCAGFNISTLSVESAVEMSISVMMSEYSVFHNHIHWAEYNGVGTGTSPAIKMSDVVKNWRNVFTSAFSTMELVKISVPLDFSHESYLKAIKSLSD